MSNLAGMIMDMWLATQHGFYSIVQKEEDLYFVRARIQKDLENLIDSFCLDAEIQIWPTADYRFRIIVNKNDFLQILLDLGAALDYSNFKGRIAQVDDQREKLGPYHRIWEMMEDMQDQEVKH
ncbi:MAG: hypothetical protein ACSHX8_07330 [Opitutaceae bacterium]